MKPQRRDNLGAATALQIIKRFSGEPNGIVRDSAGGMPGLATGELRIGEEWAFVPRVCKRCNDPVDVFSCHSVHAGLQYEQTFYIDDNMITHRLDTVNLLWRLTLP